MSCAAGAVISLILALLLRYLSSTCQLGATRVRISFYPHSKFVLVLQLVYMQLCTDTVVRCFILHRETHTWNNKT